MATMITEECINCGACEPECPNTAIYQGGVEWDASDGTKRPALSGEIFYIVPEKCTECVGFFDHEACAAVCPVDCCIPNPEIPETEGVLLARARELHPDKTLADDAPSRFRAAGGDGSAQPDAAGGAGAAPLAASAAATPAAVASARAGMTASAPSPEETLAAEVVPMDEYLVPVVCFRCTGEFEVEFPHIKPGTVLHCPHCFGSFVPNTAMYQATEKRLRRFYDSWERSFAELRERRSREIESFATSQRQALATLRLDVKSIGQKAELAGAPARNRGFFG